MPLRQKRRDERARERERAKRERERERSSCDQSIIKVEDSLN